MRSFEFARQMDNGSPVREGNADKMLFENAQLPEYQTKYSAGADFFAAEDTVVPSIWKNIPKMIHLVSSFFFVFNTLPEDKKTKNAFAPTLVHTGVKASMEDDEVLYLYNRSSNPKKMGLALANGVGVIDKDYYNNPDNDGEIMFAFYNFHPWDTHIKAGDRIGQGIFAKYLRPTVGLRMKDVERTSGFGSTNK